MHGVHIFLQERTYDSLANKVIYSLLIALALTGLTTAIAMQLGWIDPLPTGNLTYGDVTRYVELLAVFTSYSCTYLCVVQTRWNYPIGIMATIAYSILFYRLNFMASSVLNAYLCIALIYGWFRWKNDSDTRPVTRLLDSPKEVIALYLLFPVVAYAVMIATLDYFDASMPAADAAILVLTVLAQFLLDNKRLETWLVWVIINVLMIFTYGFGGAYLASLQAFVFLLNTAYGYYSWKHSMQHIVFHIKQV